MFLVDNEGDVLFYERDLADIVWLEFRIWIEICSTTKGSVVSAHCSLVSRIQYSFVLDIYLLGFVLRTGSSFAYLDIVRSDIRLSHQYPCGNAIVKNILKSWLFFLKKEYLSEVVWANVAHWEDIVSLLDNPVLYFTLFFCDIRGLCDFLCWSFEKRNTLGFFLRHS